MNQQLRPGGWRLAVLTIFTVILAIPVIAVVGAVFLFVAGPTIGWIIDPGFDGATHLVNNYELLRLKGYPRYISEGGSSPIGVKVPNAPIDSQTSTKEVGRISTGPRYIVGEITQYSWTANSLGPVVGWFIVDTAAHTSTEYANQQVWESELTARGIDPKMLELVEFP